MSIHHNVFVLRLHLVMIILHYLMTMSCQYVLIFHKQIKKKLERDGEGQKEGKPDWKYLRKHVGTISTHKTKHTTQWHTTHNSLSLSLSLSLFSLSLSLSLTFGHALAQKPLPRGKFTILVDLSLVILTKYPVDLIYFQ